MAKEPVNTTGMSHEAQAAAGFDVRDGVLHSQIVHAVEAELPGDTVPEPVIIHVSPQAAESIFRRDGQK